MSYNKIGFLSGQTLKASDLNHMEDGIIKALPLSGGTMTGALVLNDVPTADLHAATKKYVDDAVANGGELPEVTTADAGKFMRVSSTGKWAAEAIPNAEEATF